MKKDRVTKMMALICITVCVLGGLMGCGYTDSVFTQDVMQKFVKENKAAGTLPMTGQYNTSLTGTITIAGSTSMEKFANALAESFMLKYPGVTVTVEFTGSSTGIEAVLTGSVDIGNSSRNLKEAEKSSGAVENIAAIDGIAVITDMSNTVVALSTDQLAGIYKGEIGNWSEAGGGDMPIVVIGREAGSGTREAFEELLGIKDMCVYDNELNSVGAVMARVASTPGAIGYVSLAVLGGTVQAISIDGAEPAEVNIKAGNYLLSRPFVMVTNGEIEAQSEAVQEMFTYLKSEEGQELIKAAGLIVPD